jgi:hypothetical protein
MCETCAFVASSVDDEGRRRRTPMIKDATAEHILDRLSDLKNYPREVLAPYEEFKIDGKTYYFTPGGFLYRKDPETEEMGGFFCGYLTE